jgi:hypothetical protein
MTSPDPIHDAALIAILDELIAKVPSEGHTPLSIHQERRIEKMTVGGVAVWWSR